MGPRLRQRYRSHQSLSESDLEDVWSAMLARMVQAPGPNRLPADADTWPDELLCGYLKTAFGREIGRAAQRATTGEGVRLHSPLEDLAEEAHRRGAMFTDAAPAGPEQSIFERLDAIDYAAEIRNQAGPQAAAVLFADAIGASSREQQHAAGVTTRSPFETLRGRLEIAGRAMARRVQAVVLWVLPDSLLRWLSPVLATGSVPRLGAVGLTLTALAASTAGVTSATHTKPAAPRALKPAALGTADERLRTVTAPVKAAVEQAHVRQVAASRAVTQRRAAAKRRARKRASAEREAKASAAAVERQFSAPGITASLGSGGRASQPAAPAVSGGDRATADEQFGLGE